MIKIYFKLPIRLLDPLMIMALENHFDIIGTLTSSDAIPNELWSIRKFSKRYCQQQNAGLLITAERLSAGLIERLFFDYRSAPPLEMMFILFEGYAGTLNLFITTLPTFLRSIDVQYCLDKY